MTTAEVEAALAASEADEIALGVVGKLFREELSLTGPLTEQKLGQLAQALRPDQMARLAVLEGVAYGLGKTARPSAEDIQLGRALLDWFLSKAGEMPPLKPLVAKKVADQMPRVLQPFKRMSKAIPGVRGRPGRDPDVVIDRVETLCRENGWSKTRAIEAVSDEMGLDSRTIWKMYRRRARRCALIADDPAIIEPEKARVDIADRREKTKYPSNAPRSKPRTSPV
jgi:hypothetical protein